MLESGRSSRLSKSFDAFMVVLILANVAAFAAETERAIGLRYADAFRVFDALSVAIFTVEYLTRLWVCVEHPPLKGIKPLAARLEWAGTAPMLIDLGAILPFYLALIVPFDPRLARLLRLIRFLKLARVTPALQTLGRVLHNERRAIFGAIVVMLGLIIVSATAMFEIEGAAQPEIFGSVPRAAWWAIATVTTVPCAR